MTSSGTSGNGGTGERPLTARRWLPLAFLVAGLALFFALGGARYLDFAELSARSKELREFVELHPLAAPLVYLLGYVVFTACALPEGALLTMLGGYLFGPLLATALVLGGATVGATLLFLAARSSLGALLAAKAGPHLARLKAGFRANALSYLLFLRLVPVFPFWLVNLVPALLDVRLRTFVLATFVGIIPGTVVFALAGSGMAELIESGRRPALDDLLRPGVLLPLIALALLALVPVAYKALSVRKR